MFMGGSTLVDGSEEFYNKTLQLFFPSLCPTSSATTGRWNRDVPSSWASEEPKQVRALAQNLRTWKYLKGTTQFRLIADGFLW